MEESTEEEECCCCSCCSWCLGGRAAGKRKKYAGIKYELVPRPYTGQHKSYHHQQQPHPAVIVPPDMQKMLPSDHHHYTHSQQHPPFTVTQQPKWLNSPGSGRPPRYSPHMRLLEPTNRTPSPTSSLSEDSTTPALTKLRSVARSPEELDERSDTIDISQSPTGTFSSAYQRSQKRRSYGAASTLTTTHTSSSEETEVDTSSSSRGKSSKKSGESFSSEPDSLPVLQMSFYYHVENECLSVSLHGAQNLPPKRHKSYTLLLHLLPERADKLETKITGEDPNPSLAQSFDIGDIPRDNVRQYRLVVRLHDGSSAGELLGTATVSLEKTDLFGMICNVFLDTSSNKVSSTQRHENYNNLCEQDSTQECFIALSTVACGLKLRFPHFASLGVGG
jgi:hypothetical protein